VISYVAPDAFKLRVLAGIGLQVDIDTVVPAIKQGPLQDATEKARSAGDKVLSHSCLPDCVPTSCRLRVGFVTHFPISCPTFAAVDKCG
jgi:hypothetical protein